MDNKFNANNKSQNRKLFYNDANNWILDNDLNSLHNIFIYKKNIQIKMRQEIEPLRIIEGTQLENLKEKLNEQFGIKEIPGRIMLRGKERVFLFTGNITEENLRTLEQRTFVERAGTYIAKNVDGEYRLSIEGSQIFKNQITKNIVELTEVEMLEWMHGSEVLKETGIRGFAIMKYKEDMLGTGKASEAKITNFIPKSRRLKRKENN